MPKHYTALQYNLQVLFPKKFKKIPPFSHAKSTKAAIRLPLRGAAAKGG